MEDRHDTLDPEAAEVLRRVREAGFPEWHTLRAEDARATYRRRAQLLGADSTPVRSVVPLIIEGRGGPLRVKVIDPGVGDGEAPLPVLVYVHGGGWTLGDVDTFEEVCRRYAVAVGCLVVAPDYRLAPEDPYPAALDDVESTLDWVLTNAAVLGGDPSRVAIGGDSAGGNIAAGLCLRLRDRGGPRPIAQLLIYPALRARFDTTSYERNATGYLLTRDDMRWFWSNYLSSTPAEEPYACPGEAEDLEGLPPAVMITAGFDPLRSEGRAFSARLRASGVEVVELHFAGQVHGFIALPVALVQGREAVRRSAAALRRIFDGSSDDRVRGA